MKNTSLINPRPVTFVLIDHENLQPLHVDYTANTPVVFILYTFILTPNLKARLAQSLNNHGKRGKHRVFDRRGHDALDNILQFDIGRYSVKYPNARFYILSKDTGFDIFANNIHHLGVNCQRVTNIDAIEHLHNTSKASEYHAVCQQSVAPVSNGYTYIKPKTVTLRAVPSTLATCNVTATESAANTIEQPTNTIEQPTNTLEQPTNSSANQDNTKPQSFEERYPLLSPEQRLWLKQLINLHTCVEENNIPGTLKSLQNSVLNIISNRPKTSQDKTQAKSIINRLESEKLVTQYRKDNISVNREALLAAIDSYTNQPNINSECTNSLCG